MCTRVDVDHHGALFPKVGTSSYIYAENHDYLNSIYEDNNRTFVPSDKSLSLEYVNLTPYGSKLLTIDLEKYRDLSNFDEKLHVSFSLPEFLGTQREDIPLNIHIALKSNNASKSDVVLTDGSTPISKDKLFEINAEDFKSEAVGINDQVHIVIVNLSNQSHTLQAEVGLITKDCNLDGTKDDIAFLTRDGGFISEDSEVSETIIVENGARVCGGSTIKGPVGLVSGSNMVFDNSTIGDKCAYIGLVSTGEFNIANKADITSSTICTKSNSEGADFHFVVKDGRTDMKISNSTIDGKFLYIENTKVTDSNFSNVEATILESRFKNVSQFYGNVYIEDARIEDSKITAPLVPNTTRATPVIFSIQHGTVVNGSTVGGYGLIEGLVDASIFEASAVNASTHPYIGHIYRTGELTNGSTFEGNSYLAGKMINSYSNGLSKIGIRSGIQFGSTLGTGSSATGYFGLGGSGTFIGVIHNQSCSATNGTCNDIDL